MLVKNKKLIPPLIVLGIYLILGLFVYFSVFADNLIEVREREEPVITEEMEAHPASVVFIVENGSNTVSYSTRLTTKDTVMELLEYHLENSGFVFTKTNYTYGTVLDSVNGYTPPEGREWAVFDGDMEITHDLENVELVDGHTYVIRTVALQ